LLLLAAAVLAPGPALVGCGPRPEQGAIVLGVAQAPANLDPRLATDAASERINRLLYARLVELDDAGRPVPGLACWDRLSPLRYRFELAADRLPFSDGRPVTARDAAATYRSILDGEITSPHRAVLSIIEQIEVIDDRRLVFELREPDRLFPAYLGIGIVPARLIGEGRALQRAPVGSGPFRFVDWPTPGRLVLERRRDQQRLVLERVKDPNVRVMKLLRGEVDLLQNDLPPELLQWLRQHDGVRVETAPGINFSYLGFNLADPVTGDVRVRRAIAHAIDRDAILRWLFKGFARKAEALLPPEHWAGIATLAPYRHDLGRARQLLAEAGVDPEHGIVISYKTSSDPFRLRLASVLQAQLAEIGIHLEIESYDWGTFFGDIKAGRFQLYGLTWVGIRLPDIFRYVFHSESLPPEGANRGRYRSPDADRLIDAARGEQEAAVQARRYRELQALLHQDLPYIPLWYEDQVAAMRGDLIGYRLAPDGNYDGLGAVERVTGRLGDHQLLDGG
jgi:peptide/nickel transport system substrate-binding protein